MHERDELRRVLRGAIWGALATVAMVIFLGLGLGWSASLGHVRASFPRLIVGQVLGRDHGFALGLLSFVATFAFGALAGVVFAYFSRPMTFAKGVGLGIFLWFVTQITFIPWLGLSDFGLVHGGRFAFLSLIVFLAYGGTLGALGARDESQHHATFDDLGRLQVPS